MVRTSLVHRILHVGKIHKYIRTKDCFSHVMMSEVIGQKSFNEIVSFDVLFLRVLLVRSGYYLVEVQ